MKTLASFSNLHSGEAILVCGCGRSLNELEEPSRFLTIGVNDVGRLFQPNYLVVVNPREQFSGDRFRYVESSLADLVFTQLDLGLARENVVKFSLGEHGGTDFSDHHVLHYTQNSPYVALCLAIHMGAKRIGLIGIDFTDHHFFADTGIHSLTPQLSIINEQYRRLNEAATLLGVEVYNLSQTSRLDAFPKIAQAEFAARYVTGKSRHNTSVASSAGGDQLLRALSLAQHQDTTVALPVTPRVLIVNYNFLTCGDVLGAGLCHAAEELGLSFECTFWDNPNLPAMAAAFAPDMILVVHGRKFAERWQRSFSEFRTAVWLVDEPYEVDDTARWSGNFDTVFINDPNTSARHHNAHYLPLCFDPVTHRDPGDPRPYQVGFVGGFNETRNRCLEQLAQGGQLSYVVGGPWRSSAVQSLSLGTYALPRETTALYQKTQIVVNVFRDIHHFNASATAAYSLNPRVYEALACGALVVSEPRPELTEVFPELPTFEDFHSLAETLRRLLADPVAYQSLLKQSRQRLTGHSYADRLNRVLEICLGWSRTNLKKAGDRPRARTSNVPGRTQTPAKHSTAECLPGWLSYGNAATVSTPGMVDFFKPDADGPGSENGLVSTEPVNEGELTFELWLEKGAHFIAKIHQADQLDQKSNSYHLVASEEQSYAAKHNHIFGRLQIKPYTWQAVSLRCLDQRFSVCLNGYEAIKVQDAQLPGGFCFVGIKEGRAKVRALSLRPRRNGNRAIKPAEITQPATSTCSCTSGADHLPAPGSQRWPFTATPTRNLMYHIWPVAGSMWRWNLDQLKRRLEIFNGRRVMSIVHDQRSVAPQEVQDAFKGHGFEFVIASNDERGEAITFAEMLHRVLSDDTNEVTFYGHAKGVKYEPDIPLTIRRWSEVQYQVALDDWLTVQEQLQRYAMTGPFKRLGRFNTHHNLADWHYSGTYFWMRNAQVFARNHKEIPQFYGGVETWPGTIFSRDETTCLFIDNLGPDHRHHPYYPEFWDYTAEPAIHRWQSTLKPMPPPPDLIQPEPYKGDREHRMEQKPEEFQWWLEMLLAERVSSLLIIGGNDAGLEWHLAREFREHGRTIEITSIKPQPGAAVKATFDQAEQNFRQSLNLITASQFAGDRSLIADQYGAVFIDGDHSYKGCREDFSLALSLRPRLIALHDIVDSDWHAYARCCVSRVWRELMQQYSTRQNASTQWGGIGVVVLNTEGVR